MGVNCWVRDNWEGERGSYTGTATAASDYDTLEQLAKNITGKASDADLLRFANPFVIEPIRAGAVVDVSELLTLFEDRLRENVVEAAQTQCKAAEFGSKDAAGRTCLGIGEKAINRIPAVIIEMQPRLKNWYR